MGIFKRLRSLLSSSPKSGDSTSDLELDDPTFGHLRGHRSGDCVYWEAVDRFTEHGQDAIVRIFGEESGPTDRQRELFTELRRRYPQLREMMAEPLAAEFETIRRDWELESPPLSSCSDVWNVARLYAIEINKAEHQNGDLVLDHSIDWDADHDLNVAITDWKISQSNI